MVGPLVQTSRTPNPLILPGSWTPHWWMDPPPNCCAQTFTEATHATVTEHNRGVATQIAKGLRESRSRTWLFQIYIVLHRRTLWMWQDAGICMYGQEPGTCDKCQWEGSITPQPNRRCTSNSGVLLNNCSHGYSWRPQRAWGWGYDTACHNSEEYMHCPCQLVLYLLPTA